jgi:hypothetical protein
VFAERVLGGGPVLGHRIRFLDRRSGGESGEFEAGPWLEIVGVVPDFTLQHDFDAADPELYLPMSLADAPTVLGLAVRIRGGSTPAFAGRLRDVAAAVDPALRLDGLQNAADFERHELQAILFLGLGIAAVTASVLLLSATGIYAMMSFTVARRRKEIGIRTALGARPGRLLAGIFSRAAWQLGIGGLIGSLLGGALLFQTGLRDREAVIVLGGAAVLMLMVGLAAVVGPARRGLGIQPMEALREE